MTIAPALPLSDTISPKESRVLVAQLKRSQVFRDYEKAFRDTTGLPITLRPIEAFDLPHHGDPRESPFCSLMSRANHSCAACLQLHKRVEESARTEATTLRCFAGLSDSAVPVRVGKNLIAYLQTGQVFLQPPQTADFEATAQALAKLGITLDPKQLEAAYFGSRVLTRPQYESIVRLLVIFAQHLSVLSNQLLVQGSTTENPAVARARAIIAERYATPLTLHEIARAVNMSIFYFCKSFKRATGMTFTEYLARVRVERVKSLLLNPNTRISEAAYECGFQSLSQFNRTFRHVAGESPSAHRHRLHGAAATA